MAIGASAFTQFLITKIEENQWLGELLNTDYKVSGLLHYRIKNFGFRAQFYHVSSHLSDDYIVRNGISGPNSGTRNYEQIDVTGSIQLKNLRWYAGLGYVFTRYALRERLSMETGMTWRKKITKQVGYFSGLDLILFEQNNFTPDINVGFGIELGNRENLHAAIILNYFNGFLPYSTIEAGRISWLGPGIILLPPVL